eukprot:gene10694-2793_t
MFLKSLQQHKFVETQLLLTQQFYPCKSTYEHIEKAKDSDEAVAVYNSHSSQAKSALGGSSCPPHILQLTQLPDSFHSRRTAELSSTFVVVVGVNSNHIHRRYSLTFNALHWCFASVFTNFRVRAKLVVIVRSFGRKRSKAAMIVVGLQVFANFMCRLYSDVTIFGSWFLVVVGQPGDP